jgi:hypothetical protein
MGTWAFGFAFAFAFSGFPLSISHFIPAFGFPTDLPSARS